MHIKVDECDALYLRRLLFEIDGQKAIISVLANCDSHTEWHGQKYEEACHDLTAVQTEYDLALDGIRDKYVPDDLRDDKHTFRVDFKTNEIVIEERGCCASAS